jgi:ABC-type sugar transport system ATPase subunit
MSNIVLELRDMVKTFPGVRALDGARLVVREGECHGLVGENGAGKSTLMNIAGGVCRPDSGSILLDGKPLSLANPHQAAQLGIAVVFQELSLAQNMSVAENIFANRQPTDACNFIKWTTLHYETAQLLAQFELDVNPCTLVKHLSVAQRQVVEILKALSIKPRVVILDEPTSSLTAVETRLLFNTIRRLKKEGVAFIYISHHLPEIFEITDRVTVMRDGRYVETFETAGVTEDTLVRRMVGRELTDMFGSRSAEMGEEYFRVESASQEGLFHDITFGLKRGEIVGLAGLVGAGRTELARAVCGIDRLDRGSVLLDGVSLDLSCPADAIRHGIGYLTEDRKDQGLFPGMAIRDNCAAPGLDSFANKFGWMDDSRIDESAVRYRQVFSIATPSIHQLVGNLSGGNQQKVLLAMWMGIKPTVLIVDEPTRGIDVGARCDIYSRLRALAATGVGILMISSDLQEILGLSDRVLVMRGGRLTTDIARSDATEEKIIAMATGVTLN